jgi:hypothetical protein
MHNGRANDCNHLAKRDRASRHARDFSFKVPAKPVMKTGAGVLGFAAHNAASRMQGQGLNPDMVINQVNDLIDFVAAALRQRPIR